MEHHANVVAAIVAADEPAAEAEVQAFITPCGGHVLDDQASRRRESVERLAEASEVGGRPAAGVAVNCHTRFGGSFSGGLAGPDVDRLAFARERRGEQPTVVGNPAGRRWIFAGNDVIIHDGSQTAAAAT